MREVARLSREKLHELVWSKPVMQAAKDFGISDVALAKECRLANVPIPPRGYWAKKRAGRPVTEEPLPSLAACASRARSDQRVFSMFPAALLTAATDADVVPDDQAELEFEDFELTKRRIRELVGEIVVPRAITAPAPAVARLLEEDKRRRTEPRFPAHSTSETPPLFATPLQRRRLRILSAFLSAVQRLKCKIEGSTYAGERFLFQVADWPRGIRLFIERPEPATWSFWQKNPKEIQNDTLRLDLINPRPSGDQVLKTWRDGSVPLESRLTGILCGILTDLEQDARKASLDYRARLEERRAAEALKTRVQAERAEQKRVEQEQAQARQWRDALLGGADALEQAERIRRYVAAAKAVQKYPPESAEAAAFGRWATAALTEANRLDPVVNGDLLTQIDAHRA